MTTEYGPPAREVFETPASTTATGPPGVPGGVPGGAPARRRSLAKREAEDRNSTVADVGTAAPPPPAPDPVQDTERAANGAESFFGKIRSTRQSFRNNQSQSETGRLVSQRRRKREGEIWQGAENA